MGKVIVCHDKDGIEKEFDSDQFYFRPSVYGILVEDGKVLMSRQWDGYDFPGGGMKKYETIEETLKREYWEEVGLEVRMKDLIYCDNSFYVRMNGEPVNALTIYYMVEKIGGELGLKSADELEKEYIGEPEWISLEKVNDIKIYNSINNKELFKKVLKNNF
ncbi:NUDIX domain-containing protein [Candidatus Falkowbacteria bacterium]|nr:NUDIX domain-containing protein [Candidatus Falkowbacteria bacterium]